MCVCARERVCLCVYLFSLVGFYGVSTIVGYSMLNPLYTYTLYIYIYIYDL